MSVGRADPGYRWNRRRQVADSPSTICPVDCRGSRLLNRRVEDASMLWHSGRLIVLCIASAALVSACGGSQSSPGLEAASLDAPEVKAALEGIRGAQIKQHMSALADDALEGRGLGDPRNQSALSYVETAVKSYDLARPPEKPAVSATACATQEQRRSWKTGAACGVRSAPGRADARGLHGLPPRADSPARRRSPSTMHRWCSSATASAQPALGYDDYGAGAGSEGQGRGLPEPVRPRCSRATSARTIRRGR